MKIYFDNSATTPVSARILEKMRPYFDANFGNPSSIHGFGQKAREAVDLSRLEIASILNCSPSEIIFTSGGSESDNLAIRGMIDYFYVNKQTGGSKPHFITSKIEHHAVLNTIKQFEDAGRIEATYLPVDEGGMVDPEDVRKSIKRNTLLISVMYVNNEVGTIEPIREMGKMIEKLNRDYPKDGKMRRIYFHTDAVQAAPYYGLNVQHLHVDLMTLSAHKINGPKGIGLLYTRAGTPIIPQITGGEQEYGHRAGTENVPSIIGFAEALNITQFERKSRLKKVKKLKDYFENKLKREIEGVIINGDKKKRAPHILNVTFAKVEGEAILLSLDLEGIAASSGSACTSGSLDPSHVLIAMGVKPLAAQGSIRFSLNPKSTKAEIDFTIMQLKKIIKRLRDISPL